MLDARTYGQMLPIYSDGGYVYANVAELPASVETQKQPETKGRQSRGSASHTECVYRNERTGRQGLSNSRKHWH